jgi:hypothetical protein
MDYPTYTTILIGAATMAVLLVIDWYVWSRTSLSDLRGQFERTAEPGRQQQALMRAA